MKCTNKTNNIYKKRNKKKARKRKRITNWFLTIIALTSFAIAIMFFVNRSDVCAYENMRYRDSVYQMPLRADSLCVATNDVLNRKINISEEVKVGALFDVSNGKILYSENIHAKVYPASTTKILTAYLALKYGKLDDVVTVSRNAIDVPLDSSRAWLITGDKISLENLLYALMLPSGNDSAVAIAEHISGTEEDFVKLMNEEAKKLGATNTHFVNSHGYHHNEHYTTAYDLYLILNECVKNETFLKIVSSTSYSLKIEQKNGTYRNVTWQQSNQFLNGKTTVPSGAVVIGGKTGTTDEAGACLIQYSSTDVGTHYISVIMGAKTKPVLYENMSKIILLSIEQK